MKLEIVCRDIPVLTIEKNCACIQCASWLLQAATDSSCSSTTTLFKYFQSDRIEGEYAACGYDSPSMLLAHLKRDDLWNVCAMATSKKLLMLALVVAMVIHERCSLSKILGEARKYDPMVEEPLANLCNLALHRARRQ
jgi:hypothetical protein